jgi:hypothetical protein
MAKTFTAPFAQTPKTATALSPATAATISSDTATNTTALMTAGADGCIVTNIQVIPRSTVTATAVYLLVQKAATPAVQRLIDSTTVAAQTLAATQTTGVLKTKFSDYSESFPLRLEAGDVLHVGVGTTQAAGTLVFKAEYTDF